MERIKNKDICVKILYEKIKRTFSKSWDWTCGRKSVVLENSEAIPNWENIKKERITLTENEKVEPEERKLMKIFDEYFSGIVSYLNIQHPLNITLHHDLVQYAMKKIRSSDICISIFIRESHLKSSC